MKRLLVSLLFVLPLSAHAQQTGPAAVNGCIYNSAAPVLTNGQSRVFQCDANANLKTAITGTVPLPTGASTSEQQTQINNTITTLSNAFTAGTISETVFGIYNTTVVSPTNGQSVAIQMDQNGRVIASTGTANQISSTPTISTAVYSAGNCIGGFNSIAATLYNGQSAFLTNFRISSIDGAAYQIFGYIFDSNPSTSTCTDKGVFSLSVADIDKVIGTLSSTTLSVLAATATTPTVAIIDYTPPRPFRAGGSPTSGVTTIYYGLALAAAITPTTTSDLHLRFGILRD